MISCCNVNAFSAQLPVISNAEMVIAHYMQLTEGEYCQPGESVQMPRQTSAEFSSGELRPAERHDVDQQAAPSSAVKKSSQQRPLMGRVTSTLDSSSRFRRPQFSPTG